MTTDALEAALAGLPAPLREKIARCRDLLRANRRVVVAFSGGVDSALLLALSAGTLGTGNVLAAVGVSPSLPASERAAAADLAATLGVRVEEVETREFGDPAFTANPPDRCFHCKTELLTRLKALAEREGFDAVVTGANADDAGDFRPGLAAGKQLGAAAPLMDAALTKPDIRAAARALGLSVWDKPAAACLASRVPYGQPITPERLARIAQAEAVLADLGFDSCRVRDHGPVARIEVPPEAIDRAVALRDRLVKPIKDLGFAYVTLDLEGFRSGSMNEVL